MLARTLLLNTVMVEIISKYNLNISFILLRKHLKKLLICLVWINFALWYPGRTAHGEIFSKISRQSLETRYTIIHYDSLKDIKRFNSKIDYSPDEGGLKGLFSISGSKDPISSIKKKVDSVFERVQEILDMHRNMEKVVIIIYPNNKRFYEARTQIIGENLIGKNRRIRSWYIFKQNAIYINAADVHEGILAHELAHAIIDHYLTIRPPRATAEILARYVDKHLYF
jgi:hypothetical protein